MSLLHAYNATVPRAFSSDRTPALPADPRQAACETRSQALRGAQSRSGTA